MSTVRKQREIHINGENRQQRVQLNTFYLMFYIPNDEGKTACSFTELTDLYKSNVPRKMYLVHAYLNLDQISLFADI